MSRLELGAHTGIIREFVLDESRNLVITASDDKTIRLWDASDGFLYRTYRIPLSTGHVGQLFTLDLNSPAGVIATAGWTPNTSNAATAVYFLEVDTGEIVARLDNLPDIISTLRFSNDGTSICIAFSSVKPGLRCYSYPQMEITFEDFNYKEMIRRMQWLDSGELITAASDGLIVKYSKAGNRLAEKHLLQAQPASSALSADEELLAVGLLDRGGAIVLNASDLSLNVALDAPDAQQRNLPAVAFGPAGKILYAAGDHEGRNSPVYRWDLETGKRTDLALPSELRVTWFEARSDGSLIVATEDPALMAIDSGGQEIYKRRAPLSDFSDDANRLRLSPDGGTVLLGNGQGSGFTFRLGDRKLFRDGSRQGARNEAATQSAGLSISGWQNGREVLVNGNRLKKHPGELIRSLAVSPTSDSFALGGEWSVTRYTLTGDVQWRVELSSIAWQVNVSSNGRVLVAALSDGSLRWYDYRSGREIVAFYKHPDDHEWILWSPDGYYASSPRGDNYLGWHVNRQLDQVAFYRAVQFERIFYRPDIVSRHISAGLAGGVPGSLPPPDFSRITPPQIAVLNPPWVEQQVRQGRYALDIQWSSASSPIEQYNVYVNNIPVLPLADRSGMSQAGRATLTIPLFDSENIIRVEARAGRSLGVAETRVRVAGLPGVQDQPRNLYVVSVGASEFENYPPELQLQFSANDALAIESLFGESLAEQFDNVYVESLTDLSWDLPTKSNIEQALTSLGKSTANDTVVLFLASHGLSNDRGDYYFVPRDANLEDLQRIYDEPDAVTSMVPWTTFVDALADASGRRYLIVDTCHAEQIGGDLELVSLAKRSAASSFALLAAAQGGEESQEMPSVQHGVFTYGLVSAVEASVEAGRTNTVEELFAQAFHFVEKYRPNPRKPQTPQLTAPDSLREFNLLGELN
ncbi:MAG: caspase family protein [Halioglobus sp.]